MWLDLVMLAAWENTKTRVGNHTYNVKRGQYVTTTRNLMYTWRCCSQTATEFLKMLEEEGLIVREKFPKISIITIKNYEDFQPSPGAFSATKSSSKVEHNKELKKNNKIISSTSLLRNKNFEFQNSCLEDLQYLEIIAKANEISVEEVKEWLPKFTLQALSRAKEQDTLSDYRNYFGSWLRIILESKKQSNTNQSNSSNHADKFSARRGTDAKNNKPDDYDTSF